MKKPLLCGIILTVCVVIVAFVFAQFYPEGMISYWKLDDGSGTTASDSVDANDGTLVNGPVWTAGQVGGALSFDGLDDYVTVPSNGLSSNPMTISWWMNTNDMSAVLFMDKASWPDTEGMEIWLYDNSGGYGYLNVRGSGGTNVASGSDFHGEWVHVAVVFDGTTVTIYRNGAFDTSGTIEQISTSTKDFTMGMYPGLSGWHLNGIIDEVAIYNRVLTPEEIQQHYQDGLHGLGYDVECVIPPSDMVSWWPGDGNADDIWDANNGTLQNDAAYAAGRVDQAFSFDGVDEYMRVPDSSNLEFDRYTFSVWVKLNAQPAQGATKTFSFLSKGTNDGNGDRDGYTFDYRIAPDGTMKLSVNHVDSSNLFQQLIVDYTLNTGQWYYLVATYDGSELKIYVDGSPIGSLPTSVDPDYTGDYQDLKIGALESISLGGVNRYCNGLIDELEIYNRALDASEIQAIYSAGGAGKCKDIVIEVDIDIKPGSYPNSINLGEHGLLPVAILGTQDFDVTTIVPGTIEIGGVSLALRGPAKKVQKLAYSYEDVSGDGNIDMMMVFFDVWELVYEEVLKAGTTELLLNATLDDGTAIEGTDSVNIVH